MVSSLEARSWPQERMRSMPPAAARATTASTSAAILGSSRCACASITRGLLGGGSDALETREERGAGLDLVAGLQHAPPRDVGPLRLLRRGHAEQRADLRAHVRRVRMEEICGEAHRSDAAV